MSDQVHDGAGKPKINGLMAVLLMAGLAAGVAGSISYLAGQAEQKRAAASEAAAAASAASAAALAQIERARLQEIEDRCVTGAPALMGKAGAALKGGEPASAVETLVACEPHFSDTKAIAMLASARQAVAAKEQKAEAAAEAARKREAKKHGVSIGMTKQQVLDSNWGRPDSVNKSHGSWGTHEQWVYDGGYLYFENGVLTSIQN